MIRWVQSYIFVFIFALTVSLILTRFIKNVAIKFKIFDQPNARKIHTAPIPLWGGLAIYLAYIFALFGVAFPQAVNLKSIIFGSFPVLLLGLIDDIKPVPATIKLVLLISLAVWLSKYGIIVQLSGIYAVDVIATALWIVGITAAFNSIDNMDGLACGISSIIALMFFIVAFASAQWAFGLLAVALFGASLGFLPFNFHQARIFLGNGGSLFLGFNLGIIAIMGSWSSNRFIALTIPVLIMAIPLFDILYVIILRYRQGLTPTLKDIINYCGKDHLSHRILRLGLKQSQVVTLLYILSICLGLGAVMLTVETNEYDAAILIVQALMIILIMAVLLNIRVISQNLK